LTSNGKGKLNVDKNYHNKMYTDNLAMKQSNNTTMISTSLIIIPRMSRG
jgi:hypothetical protein